MRLNETEMVKLLPAWMQEDGGDKGLATGCDIITSGGAALTPESDKIYIILSEGEYQNKTYRWSGTTYAVIGNDLAIGETASTAYRGDRGKTAYDHSQSPHAPADAEKNVQSDWNETDGKSVPADLPVDHLRQWLRVCRRRRDRAQRHRPGIPH